MPYKIDSITANTITMVGKAKIVDPFPYTNSLVATDFKQSLTGTVPGFGTYNGYSLQCTLNMLETTEDFYVVYLGTVTSDSNLLINNVQGSFSNVPFALFDSVTTQFGTGAIVEDASNPGSNYLIDQAFVGAVQISPNEYVVLAVFYTPNPGDTFRSLVTLEITLGAVNGSVTYSRIV